MFWFFKGEAAGKEEGKVTTRAHVHLVPIPPSNRKDAVSCNRKNQLYSSLLLHHLTPLSLYIVKRFEI